MSVKPAKVWRQGFAARGPFLLTENQSISVLKPTTSPFAAGQALIGDGKANLGFVTCDIVDVPILQAVIGTPPKLGYDLKIDGTAISGVQSRRFGRDDFSPLF